MVNYNLNRFIRAQERDYEMALLELKEGKKRSHWMWYIFPQLKGFGSSAMSEFYGIDGLEEAKAYYDNKYLREHLLEVSRTLLTIASDDVTSILGYPDDLKLQSSMTLFLFVDPKEDIFGKVLDKYYNGKKDMKTIKAINSVSKEES